MDLLDARDVGDLALEPGLHLRAGQGEHQQKEDNLLWGDTDIQIYECANDFQNLDKTLVKAVQTSLSSHSLDIYFGTFTKLQALLGRLVYTQTGQFLRFTHDLKA